MFKLFSINCIAFLFCCAYIQAQQNHFIYIQSDNKEPFYLILDGKTQYNSTITGYAIIPKLKEGKYNIEVTFVKSRAVSRANFSCSINQRDIGYLLKYIEGKGLILSDLQTQETITATPVANTNNTAINNNSFGDMLADAVNDPTLKDKKSITNNTPNTPIIIPAKQTRVVKVDQQNESQSTLITYLDIQQNGHVDTVKIAIAKNNKDVFVSNPNEKKEIPKNDTIKNIITSSTPQKNVATDSANSTYILSNTATTKVNVEQKKSLPVYNKNCHALAGNEEIEKIKRSLIQENSEEEMLTLISRQLQKKCFTTEQIKSLSKLFLKETIRFQFLKAALPSIYDIDKATTLQQELSDNYYISIFQDLLKK